MQQRGGRAGKRWREIPLHRLFVVIGVSLAFSTLSCAPGAAPDSALSAPLIILHPAASRVLPAYISVSGLSAAELSSVRDRLRSEDEWPLLLKVTIGDDAVGTTPATSTSSESLPAVLGQYAVTASAITFTPLFPFDPGRAYRVVFDPKRLPRARQAEAVIAIVRLPAVATEPTTVVKAVYPSADVVPENLLRVYIEFSAPMGSGVGLDFVRLVELTGPAGKTERVEAGAFLPVEANFWSPDHTRYTLFFDPGRVKQGILPNRQSGRPLRAGHRFVLDIASTWTDANGLPLKLGYRHAFRVGPAVDEAIKLSDWTIEPPAAGTRDRLVVAFPRPLDHGILGRALGVETKQQRSIDGEISLEDHDTRWGFAPVVPWQSGEYNLVALSFLEDPQGNQIGRAFEAFANEPKNEPGPDAFRVAFTIGSPRQ